jgi:hypothetical protein
VVAGREEGHHEEIDSESGIDDFDDHDDDNSAVSLDIDDFDDNLTMKMMTMIALIRL